MRYILRVSSFDRAAALARLGDDEELLREVVELFLSEYPITLAQIRDAVQSRDASALESSAHSLKGSIATFGAEQARQAAFSLEQLGRESNLDPAPRKLSELEQALTGLRGELESFIAS